MCDEIHSSAQFEIYVDDSLSFTIRGYTWSLPDDHEIYSTYKRSVRNITLSNLIKVVSTYKFCPGVIDLSLVHSHHLKKQHLEKILSLF